MSAPDSGVGRTTARLTAVFASGTLASRLLGLVRDVLWVRFVPTASLDAFLVAWKLPNMLRDIVGEGAMNAAFVPVFTHTREQEGEAAFRTLIRAAMTVMLLLLGSLTVVGILMMPALLYLVRVLEQVAGSTEAQDLDQAISLARWTFPYLFFIGMAVFAMGPLFTLKRYVAPAWSPALLNIAIIASICMFHKVFPGVFPDQAHALVFGVWVGGIAQLTVLFWALRRHTGVWLPGPPSAAPGVREVFLLMLPVLIGQAAGEVNKVVDTLFAYALETGTVTSLYCANRLVQLPLSLFGFSTAVAVLPGVSAAMSRGDVTEARAHVTGGLRQVVFLVLPAALGLIILRQPLVRLLFERGEFSQADTERTAAAMAILAVGLPAFALVKVVVTGFYGAKDTRTPVIVSSCAMLLNILLNFMLVRPLGYKGLVIATSISYVVNYAVLHVMLERRIGRLIDTRTIGTFLRIVLAAVLANTVGYGVFVRMAAFFMEDTLTARLTYTLVPILVTGAVYAGLCLILQVEEASSFVRSLARRLGKGSS